MVLILGENGTDIGRKYPNNLKFLGATQCFIGLYVT